MRFAALAGLSTSGVERVRSLQDWPWPARRRPLSTERENDEMMLVADVVRGADRDFTIKVAQELWSIVHRGSALSPSPRVQLDYVKCPVGCRFRRNYVSMY